MVPGLLVVILVLCWVVLIIVGLRQWRRRRRLAQFARQCGLRFSWRDPFGLIQQYGACELMQAGHSARVDGVLYGLYAGWQVRLFGLGFEVGHGPNRSVRQYMVIAAELPRPVASAFVWRDGSGDRSVAIPTPAARMIADRWWHTGDLTIACAVRAAWPPEATESIGVETAERLALCATVDPMDSAAMLRQLDAVAGCLAALASLEQTDH